MKIILLTLSLSLSFAVHAQTLPADYIAVDGSLFDQMGGQVDRAHGIDQILAILNSGAIFTPKVSLYSADWTDVPIVRPHFLGTAGCVMNRLDGGLPIVVVANDSMKVKAVNHGMAGSFEAWDFIFENGLWLQCYEGWFTFSEDIGQAFTIGVPAEKIGEVLK